MSNKDLKFSSFDALNSLNFDENVEEEGSEAAKKLLASFCNRRDAIKKILEDKSLYKETRQELKLELRVLTAAIKEYDSK